MSIGRKLTADGNNAALPITFLIIKTNNARSTIFKMNRLKSSNFRLDK